MQVPQSDCESTRQSSGQVRLPGDYKNLAKSLDLTGKAVEQTASIYQRICRLAELSEQLEQFVELFYQIQDDLSKIRPDLEAADDPSYDMRYCDNGCSKREQMRHAYRSLLIKLEALLFSKYTLLTNWSIEYETTFNCLKANERFDQYDQIYFEVAHRKTEPVEGLQRLVKYCQERILEPEEVAWCEARKSEGSRNSEGYYRVLSCDRYCETYLRFLKRAGLISDEVLPSPFVNCKDQKVITNWIVLVREVGTKPAADTQQILDYLDIEYFEARRDLYLHFEEPSQSSDVNE